MRAALSDAEAQGVGRHVFLGDYYRECPWPNEVAATLRGLDSAVVIAGNGEGYLRDMKKRNFARGDCVYEQLKLNYWNYFELTPDNLGYLAALPDSATIADGGGGARISLSHSLGVFYRSPKIKHFSSYGFRTLMEASPFTHGEYLAAARAALLSRPDAVADIMALPEGVYLFGHNHIQFHMEHEGRLFVNPGSCGVPCDFDTSAAYTTLERDGAGGWEVGERRVKYDVAATAAEMEASDMASYTPVWNKIMVRQVMEGKECMWLFFMHLKETARLLGQGDLPGLPVSNEAWDAAVKTWRGGSANEV